MFKLGIVSSVIRFAGHIPTGMMGVTGLSLYKSAKTLGDIYDVIPHGHAFLQGLKIVGQAGIATFSWNFVMFIASVPAYGEWLIMIGVVDVSLAIALIYGAVMQAKFIPRSKSGCQGAVNWRNGTDGRNFFLVANESIKFDYGSPKSTCDAFVKSWQVTLGCIALYCFCALCLLLLGCLEPPRSYSAYSTYPRSTRNRCSGLPDLLYWVFVKPFIYLLAQIVPVVRFAVRYTAKFMYRGKANRTVLARKIELSHKAPADGEKSTNLGDSTVLPTQVVNRITQHLHYVDLVNLSRSSKRLRIVFFGHGDPAKDLDQRRQYCCEGDSKSQCRVCNRQVCETCSNYTRNRKSYASQHLSRCRPVCTKCFYAEFCRSTHNIQHIRRSKHAASCWSYREKRDIEEGIGQGWETAEEPICRLCYAKTDTERMKRIEAQDAAELKRLAKHPLVCNSCKDPLPPRGPRWWICTSCNVECKSHAHPPWAA
ncbi:hypothetical protein EDB81DRAFT_487107 [Dactylonectria macrodidyma]|uniref:F-box domain-containing protein n=1 Tax=Dactylonectria macrodidyma TaxID=307937 RepID=A0A9P9EXE4_9HYPO|nr:hypothetical protein EDB81DRAFT_487107 [Dactylonectria macrodidyma]